ncbi:MAG: hypothetical protein A3C44_03095 [Gammaproteobacteria bacterium RIFCSPHIGHO2_02_FULL_39_13]|nr:MAG: hypothetical protein A3C44_03095 [Gammaproteobacteria bacterium RIFCSPHIGHO2_02_FULL_39_13]OGT50328.1 MAG: hypothetical protein A3E53_01085 [Gammaproteobacteria bacterium RIFCSPHIGHO2_12_FULL_39_24]
MRRIFLTSAFVLLASVVFAEESLPTPQATSTALPPPKATTFLPMQHRLNPKTKGDAVEAHRLLQIDESSQYSPNRDDYNKLTASDLQELPVPIAVPQSPKKLSLREAIVLALRNNPTVKIAELQRILDKFGLELAIHTYEINWNPLTFSSTFVNKTYPLWNATGGFTLATSAGTQFSLAHTNNLLGGMGSTVLTLTQPLLQNFGFEFNRIPYLNAMDSEQVARLTFKNSVMTTVVSVISAYRSLVQAYNSMDLSKESLATQQKAIEQTKLEVTVGKTSRSDLQQQEANMEGTRLQVVEQGDSLRSAYEAFLSSLGLVSSANLVIDRNIVVDEKKLPDLVTCKKIAMKNNIAYLSALLNFEITKRALITAENARKWSLNMVTSVTQGSQRSGVGSPIANIDTNPSVAFNLSIPIDNISSKQGEVSAKIAIENAKMNLEQQKEDLMRNVMSQWNSIRDQYQEIKIAQAQITLQDISLKNAELKLKYGKSSVFEVNSLRDDLLSQQTNLVTTEITYLNSVTAFRQLLGTLLDYWHIKLRY